MSEQNERSLDLTDEVHRKLTEVDKKLEGVEGTVTGVRADVAAIRETLMKYYKAKAERREETDAKR